MIATRFILIALFALTASARACAGEAQGQVTLGGSKFSMNVANAFLEDTGGGKPTTLVLLTEGPVDLSSELASPDPYFDLINDKAIAAVAWVAVFIEGKHVSVNAHKAGDETQYFASQKFGLDATVSGGGNAPIEGKLHLGGSGTSMQIDVNFKTDMLKAGS